MNQNRARALAQIRVVLSRPSHSGNVGAAARAMKTMGLSRLYLVAPQCEIDGQARALSSNALDVLDGAVHCATLEEALGGTVMAAALTARRREYAAPLKWAREAAAEIVDTALAGEVALVFGNETAGLSNEELALCRLPVMIPANPDYSSLNLAAAVQVMCYELRMAALAPAAARTGRDEPATFEDVQRFYAHLEQALIDSGFLDPANPKKLMPRLRRLFDRAALEREEVNILRGMLNFFQKAGKS
ncbi:MAG: RNA methyltransferase [Pseudomonadota bacterium]|jgi:tRNA/rRNA methyltransferase